MEEKFIKVYDDLLHPQYVDYLENLVLKTSIIPFSYTHNIADASLNFPSPGFSFYFHSESENPNHILKYEFLKILYTLSNKLNFNIKYIFEGRMFLHCPSPNPGPDGIHNDLEISHWVCLYYINDSDGDTILFKDDKKTELKRITPKKGRIIFFDGSIPHCSSRPNLNTRAIVNFDFQGQIFNNLSIENKKALYL